MTYVEEAHNLNLCKGPVYGECLGCLLKR